ncbi:MAG: PhoX family protein [Bacteroidota bacterium]
MTRLLPATSGLALLLAVGSTAGATEPAITAVTFTDTPAPAGEAEMVVPLTRSTAQVTTADGRTRSYPLSYQVLMRSGERIGDGSAGLIVDKNGHAIERSATTDSGDVAKGPFAAYSPDANSLIQTKAGPRLITHFEYHTEAPNVDPAKPPVSMYAQLPMVMTATTLVQDARSGRLRATAAANVDMAAINGLWIPCAGTLTPWNTHLGGEEYEPNARHFDQRPLEAMNLFLGTPGKTAKAGGAKPYDYGHLVEVTIKDGKARATKHYAPGRLSFELADIQDDGRTAYYGDDGRDVVRFMFVADRVGDLSSGTLYAAKWNQTDGSHGGSADLSWIRLGHASDAEIKALVDKGIAFADIFEVADKPTPGFTPVYVYPGTGGKPALEHLKLRPGMEQAAAFLESRRAAALRGATTEFTKMEGQAHDGQGRHLFTAMSYVEQGMVDGKNGDRPQDHIRLTDDPSVLACGIVYQSTLKSGQYDSDGTAIPSDWVAADMTALVMGAKPGADSNKLDKCATGKVANPDNLKFSPAMRTLFIGEDSGNHINNFLWAYNVDSKTLTRLFSAPIGAENTGLAVVESLGNHAYVFTNIQHPGAAEDLEKYPDAIKVGLRAKVDQRGAVGVLGGLPALK